MGHLDNCVYFNTLIFTLCKHEMGRVCVISSEVMRFLTSLQISAVFSKEELA